MSKAFRIEVPGRRTRSATSIHNAETTLGNMLIDEPNGTLGSISQGGQLLLVGESETLGWVEVR